MSIKEMIQQRQQKKRGKIIQLAILLSATWLAQLGERWSAEREVAGSNPGLTNNQGF